ncbi:hypothetical protein [Wolbachia endosymbiont of Ctenocephalides felis wCfeJ]|nr:hypothetical protein [Wolbachia endosymbiont of Ctenocephalides felis wCfeJ]WCR58389.1 MAG: hypothetical protein PG980_000861 [Wolbachia endosymbiont of Ctenocephalides felis wCfeJ]
MEIWIPVSGHWDDIIDGYLDDIIDGYSDDIHNPVIPVKTTS